VYAVWDKDRRLRRCRWDRVGPWELRFHIIRLDGDDLEEKIKWYDPQHLTQDDYRRHIKDVFYGELRLSNYTGNCSTALVKKVILHIFQIHSMRTPGTPTFITLANDLQDALPVDDYLTVLHIFERFGTVNGFPQVESCLEYNVHFRHDPHADAYAELLAHMRHNAVLAPRFERRNELTASGPMDNPARRRAMDRAAEELRARRPQEQEQQPQVEEEEPQQQVEEQEPQPQVEEQEPQPQPQPQQSVRQSPAARVDPANHHHLAMPHGSNTNRDTRAPQSMEVPDYDIYADAVGHFAWSPNSDEQEAAAAVWVDVQ
jgi:hypothetical protein